MAAHNPQTDATPQPAREPIARLAAIPSGRRAKWLVLVAWIVIIAVVSPFAGKLADVEENDAEQWLPESAESLAVTRLMDTFPAGETEPGVIVYHRDGGLTDADRARVEADRVTFTNRYPATPPTEPVPSEDGAAILYAIPFPADQPVDGKDASDNVAVIRDVLGPDRDGLEVKVTGPAGFGHDLVSVFDGIDGTLLMATAGVVTILLLLTYRSPFLWLIPLIAVAFAHQTATAGVYGAAKHLGVTVDGQSGGILPVLVFGAGTDYALLLISRYREELRRHADKHEAMFAALRQAGPAILTSGGTVVAGLLCLMVADLNSTASLDPVGALGIISALVAMLTLLPVILVIVGRRVFWPFVPHFGSASHEESGIWSAVGRWVDRRPRPVWIGTVAVMAIGLIAANFNLANEDQFRDEPDAITGQKLIAASYPAGASQPNTVIANLNSADAVQAVIADTPGVADVRIDGQNDTQVAFATTLDAAPSSDAAYTAIERLRDNVHAIPSAGALVGGPDASSLDIRNANERDRMVIMPLVLLVVLIILCLLLRSIVAPLVLTATVVLSFAASLGVSVLVFEHLFGFNGIEPSIPLLGFVFLVALGIDYNIFLMSRVHEEARQLGTRRGMLRGLSVTGGVITSAGLVLAATFAVLGVLPLVSLTELGFIVAFGVLLDTLVVRSILVPALTLDLGPRMWWPSRLAHHEPSILTERAIQTRQQRAIGD